MGLSGGDGTRNLTTMQNKTELKSTETHASIKLGIDAHAKWFYVARQVDGATPQPVQKMTFEGLLRFVAKQQCLAREVYTCYEAGAFGYHLHRRLTAKGVTNYVVQPQDWDERGKGVKNDRLTDRGSVVTGLTGWDGRGRGTSRRRSSSGRSFRGNSAGPSSKPCSVPDSPPVVE